jgi:hypothetical protein
LIVIGYHGCDRQVRDSIVSRQTQHLNISKNPYDWLGSGAYFFEDDAYMAMDFAKTAHENPAKQYTAKPVNTPAVLGAVIEMGNCWDLRKMQGCDKFEMVWHQMQAAFAQDNIPLPVNKPGSSNDGVVLLRHRDRAVIDLGCRLAITAKEPAIDTVMSIFELGERLTENSGFRKKTHVQISVRNPEKSILGYFVPVGTS